MSNNPFMDYQQQMYKIWSENMEKAMDNEQYKNMMNLMPGYDYYQKMMESTMPSMEKFWNNMTTGVPTMDTYWKSMTSMMPQMTNFWNMMGSGRVMTT